LTFESTPPRFDHRIRSRACDPRPAGGVLRPRTQPRASTLSAFRGQTSDGCTLARGTRCPWTWRHARPATRRARVEPTDPRSAPRARHSTRSFDRRSHQGWRARAPRGNDSGSGLRAVQRRRAGKTVSRIRDNVQGTLAGVNGENSRAQVRNVREDRWGQLQGRRGERLLDGEEWKASGSRVTPTGRKPCFDYVRCCVTATPSLDAGSD
jgi:hypothetical protein